MYQPLKLYVTVLWSISGVIAIVLGITCVIYEPLKSIAVNIINKEAVLIDGTLAYQLWNMPQKFLFMIYIFNVTNPDEILKGESPQLIERGPYVYNELIQKEILEIDEIADEIKFIIKRKFSFNKARSTKVSQDDSLTILNPAYIGSINMLTTLPENLMNQFGNVIPKLFPNPKTIFVKGKAKNILFDGLRLTCNSKRNPDLTTICIFLQNSRPPIVIETAKEGVYLFSFFNHLNDSMMGPFTINRGMKNISRLGDITSYRDNHIQKIWRTEECNIVSGKDPITWPPRQEHLPQFRIFSAEICRETFVDYTNEVTIHGLKAKRYALTDKFYELENDCFCPEVKKKMKCLPKGLLDLTNCQDGPILFSEPHFLHADPDLLHYARGLNPDKKLHFTDVIAHEMTGLPITGHKRAQFNMRVDQQPVNLLANISEGYFPLLWTDETNPVELRLIAYAYQTQRLMFLLQFLHLIPIIIGMHIILTIIFLHGGRVKKTVMVNPMTQGILISRVH